MYGCDGVGSLTSKNYRKNQTIQYVYHALNRLSSKDRCGYDGVDYIDDLAVKVGGPAA